MRYLRYLSCWGEVFESKFWVRYLKDLRYLGEVFEVFEGFGEVFGVLGGVFLILWCGM